VASTLLLVIYFRVYGKDTNITVTVGVLFASNQHDHPFSLTMFGSIPPLDSLDECLADPQNPIGMRMRAAYYLRHIHATSQEDQEAVVQVLGRGLEEPGHGSLLRHEFAYVMGQMKDERVSLARLRLPYSSC